MLKTNEQGHLLCPHCGGPNLHHSAVEVFAKHEGNAGTHTRAGSGDPGDISVTVDGDMRGNPGGRRGGVVVRFWCEGCPALSALELGQHKGVTEAQFFVTGGIEE